MATSFEGCRYAAHELGADVQDISPILDPGVDWEAVGKMHERITEPCDVLVYQASINPKIIARARALNPRCLVVVQRDSTHAAEHLRLMRQAMAHHGIVYQHAYERGLLEREVGEYAEADRVFVLSRWVKSTFEKQGLGHKAVQFASQLAEVTVWDQPEAARKPEVPFRACFAGQLGLRKGVLDMLEGWRLFRERTRADLSAMLSVAGMIEDGAVPALRKTIDEAFARTPDCERLHWLDRDGMKQLYARSHVLLMASVEEGGSMTGPEAALAGCALVATRNCGFDILESGVTGLEVRMLNAQDVCDALTVLANDRDLCHSLGQKARERALRCDERAYADGFARALVAACREHGL